MATRTENRTDRRSDVNQTKAMIEKNQQLVGHFPGAEAMGWADRIIGEMAANQAHDELDAKYAQG